MKNELFFLAKMAVVFSVVDGLIPRAETMAKSKMNHRHNSEESTSDSDKPKQKKMPGYITQPHLSEMHVGLFDLSPFHGSGSPDKEVLDDQWETQQERGDDRRMASSLKDKIKSVKIGSSKVDVEDAAHQKSAPKFFWDLGKSGH